MLEKRKVTAHLYGEESSKQLDSGTPQGDVLLPTIWNINTNEGLEAFAPNWPTELHAYADDVLDVATGINEYTIIQNLQNDMHKLEK